jgi:hypothetical protein
LANGDEVVPLAVWRHAETSVRDASAAKLPAGELAEAVRHELAGGASLEVLWSLGAAARGRLERDAVLEAARGSRLVGIVIGVASASDEELAGELGRAVRRRRDARLFDRVTSALGQRVEARVAECGAVAPLVAGMTARGLQQWGYDTWSGVDAERAELLLARIAGARPNDAVRLVHLLVSGEDDAASAVRDALREVQITDGTAKRLVAAWANAEWLDEGDLPEAQGGAIGEIVGMVQWRWAARGDVTLGREELRERLVGASAAHQWLAGGVAENPNAGAEQLEAVLEWLKDDAVAGVADKLGVQGVIALLERGARWTKRFSHRSSYWKERSIPTKPSALEGAWSMLGEAEQHQVVTWACTGGKPGVLALLATLVVPDEVLLACSFQHAAKLDRGGRLGRYARERLDGEGLEVLVALAAANPTVAVAELVAAAARMRG